VIGVNVSIQDYKKMFFRDDFARKLASSNQRSLSLFGRNVRRSAQRRIKNARRMPLGSMSPQERNAYKYAQRRAKALGKPAPTRPFMASAPGQAPRSRTGKLKKHIYYGLEPQRENVIIGPAYLPTKEGNVAEKLEKGGTIQRRKARQPNRVGKSGIVRMIGTKPIYGKLKTSQQAARADKFDEQLFGPIKSGQVQLLARPYMQPSFNETMVEIPRLFADSIK
jgi:hypothetical protein